MVEMKGLHYTQLKPLYPDAYSWAAESRVHSAIRDLGEADSEELWRQLVSNFDDKRYCMIWVGQMGRVHDTTVGDVCFWIAHGDLLHAYLPFAPHPGGRGPVPAALQPFHSRDELTEWLRPRRDKPLYELQIDAAELAVSCLPDVTNQLFTKEQADKFIADVKTMAAQQCAAKKPVFLHAGLGLWGGHTFNEILARRIRDDYEAKKPGGK